MDYIYLVNPNKLYLYTQTKNNYYDYETSFINEGKVDKKKIKGVIKEY